MHNHCQHNLYICHCNPSSNDPSPIHPPSTAPLISTASDNGISASTTCTAVTAPVLVTQQTSVAVMTSPTLNLNGGDSKHASSASMTSLVASDGISATTTTLPGFSSCNTIPRVLVNTNGRMATISADSTLRERGKLTLVAQRPITDSTIQASNMTVASLSSPVEKYFDCLWPSHHSSHHGASSNLGSEHQQHHHHLVGLRSNLPRRLDIQHMTTRACLERLAFTLLTLVLIIVFLIAALVLVYLGTANLDHSSYSSMVYNGGSGMSSSGERNPSHSSAERKDLNIEDGIEIVRIKTTEEKVINEGNTRKPVTVIRTKKVCVTAECSELSRRILSSIDPERDPCESFYQFSCGGWMQQNPPPPRRMVHSVMSHMRDEMDGKLRGLIEKIRFDSASLSHATTDPLERINFQLATFYRSCTDVDNIRAKGSVPAVDFIHRNFPKFILHSTFLGDPKARKTILTELLLELIKVNGTPLLDITLDLSPRNSSRYIGVIKVPQRSGLLPQLTRSRQSLTWLTKWVVRHRRKRSRSFGSQQQPQQHPHQSQQQHRTVPRKEIFRGFQNALNAQRVTALVKTAEMMGILDSSSERDKQTDIDEILGFLAALEKVMPSEKQIKQHRMDNSIFNEYNLDELQTSFRFLNWKNLLNGLFPGKMDVHDVVLVHNPTYMRKLGRIISLFEPRVIWKSLLVLYAKDVLSDLVTVHHGQARWQYCTQVSSMLFGEALSRLYLQSVPSEVRNRLQTEVQEMFNGIKNEIIDSIDRLPWLSNQMKSMTKNKIKMLTGSFVGSDIYMNSTLVQDRYRGISIGHDFFDNVITMFRHFRQNIYHFIHLPVNSEVYTWNLITFPFTVNAFHLQQLNSIVIPLGLLEDPHFSENVPKYLNVATLGLTLSHEIWHSLDKTGRDFDQFGSLRKWWDQSSEKSYRNRTQCLTNQYKTHFQRVLAIDSRSTSIEVDGEFTLNENVCDVDGMKTASQSFLSLPHSPSDLIYLPNNPYTPQQLFFINAAQGYCSHLGPVSYVLYLELDEHSPNPERVDGIMMNSELFSSVFQCPVGSRMNPKTKCSVWT